MTENLQKCESFQPVINDNSKILILGSMPGIKSLEEQEYYAHAKNRFWKVMAELCNCKNLPELCYEDRLNLLLQNNFALWDTIKFCNRDGSLDSDIKNEVPNAVDELLKKYPNIKLIYLNGNKSFSVFKKYFPSLLNTYKCIKCPSTSPANARYKLEDLVKEWRNY